MVVQYDTVFPFTAYCRILHQPSYFLPDKKTHLTVSIKRIKITLYIDRYIRV